MFRFLVLTPARSGEVRGAAWAEVDIDERLWIIPGTRMKAGFEHRVPLSSAATAALTEAREIVDGSSLLFPSVQGKPMSALHRGRSTTSTALLLIARGSHCEDAANAAHG